MTINYFSFKNVNETALLHLHGSESLLM